MKKLLIVILAISFIFISFVLFNCKKGTPETKDPIQPPVVNKNYTLSALTKQPEKLQNFNNVQVDSNQLVLQFISSSNLPSYKPGDILTGTSGTGYLRKVITATVQGSSIKITTSNGTLDEAFDKIKIDTSFTLTPLNQKIGQINTTETVQINGQSYERTLKSAEANLTVNQTTGELSFVFPKMSFKIETPDKSGKFEINIDTVKLGITIAVSECVMDYANLNVNKFSLIYQVDSKEEFKNVSMLLKGGIDEQIPDQLHEDFIPKDIFLGYFPIGPVIIGFYFNLARGIQGKFLMGAGTSLVSSMTESSSYLVGGKIENSTPSLIWEKSNTGNSTVSFAPIANISGIAKAFLKPKINVKVFDIAGPTVFIRGFGYGEVTYPPIKAEWGFGLDGGLGFNVSFFSKKIASIDWVLAEYRWPQWSSLNNPPTIPVNLNPSSNSTGISLSTTLGWTSTDPEKDSLTYDVYFGTATIPVNKVIADKPVNTYSPSGLSAGTDYYWQIIVKDSKGNSTPGPIWKFTTVVTPNQQPTIPANPNPSNNATGISLSTTLSWTSTDPENDPITYDVYFGTSTNPTNLVSPNQSSKSFVANSLSAGTDYYWKIVAKDNHNNIMPSPIWKFTTQSDNSAIIFNPNLTYGTISDNDGNTYKTIQIGSQVWMAENLKTTKYNNGDPIQNVTADGDWAALNTGAYCWPNNDELTYKSTYGALYNWFAVNDIRNIAPAGWHVATDEEWTILTTNLTDATPAGGKLKEIGFSHWPNPNTGASNSSGFTALPGGLRDNIGAFTLPRFGAGWWSSSTYDANYAWYRLLSSTSAYISRYYGTNTKKYGFTVRCVKN